MVDAREYLESIRRDELRIGLKLRLIQNLRDQLCSISGSVANEQVSHTRNVSVMADTMATIVDMQNEIDHQANEIVKRKQKAYLLLDQINPESAAILVDYYFDKKTIITIGRSIHLERRQTYRRLNEALAELQIVLDSSELQAPCHRSV